MNNNDKSRPQTKRNKADLYKLSDPHKMDNEEIPPDGLGLQDTRIIESSVRTYPTKKKFKERY